MEEYDIIIIGAGPGGLTAGIYAGRQGTRNLIIDRDLAGGIGREVPEMEELVVKFQKWKIILVLTTFQG